MPFRTSHKTIAAAVGEDMTRFLEGRGVQFFTLFPWEKFSKQRPDGPCGEQVGATMKLQDGDTGGLTAAKTSRLTGKTTKIVIYLRMFIPYGENKQNIAHECAHALQQLWGLEHVDAAAAKRFKKPVDAKDKEYRAEDKHHIVSFSPRTAGWFCNWRCTESQYEWWSESFVAYLNYQRRDDTETINREVLRLKDPIITASIEEALKWCNVKYA
jgi:hypothetical protein